MKRSEIQQLATEIYKLMRKDVQLHISAIAQSESDEFLTHAEAAKLLGTTTGALYHKSGIPYTTVGRKRMYSKQALMKYVRKDNENKS